VLLAGDKINFPSSLFVNEPHINLLLAIKPLKSQTHKLTQKLNQRGKFYAPKSLQQGAICSSSSSQKGSKPSNFANVSNLDRSKPISYWPPQKEKTSTHHWWWLQVGPKEEGFAKINCVDTKTAASSQWREACTQPLL